MSTCICSLIRSKFPLCRNSCKLYQRLQGTQIEALPTAQALVVLTPLKKAQCHYYILKSLTPNDHYSGRTAPLTSKRCVLYVYSTNICTEYFIHDTNSPFFSPQNAVCFIILTYLVPVLLTFYIQDVLKLKKKLFPAPKG